MERLSRAARAVVLAIAALAIAPGCAPSPGPAPRNLLIVSLDTVRRDHLPTYGYDRDTAPRIDELARVSTVFDGAFSQETNTTPSHASMFTGAYPHQHGALDNGFRLPEDRPTLAGILRRAGFRTAGFVSATPLKGDVSGLDRGFDTYDDRFEEAVRDGRLTAEQAARWIAARPSSERWFCFLHLYEAHGPYLPPPGYRDTFSSPERGPVLETIPPYQVIADEEGRPLRHLNEYVDLYDAEIRYLDDLLGAVLSTVDFENTVVVVLSDHGEVLGGRHHVLDHGGELWEETTRIPLVVYVPGWAPRRVADAVETVDLLPTLAQILGVESPDALGGSGRSLVPALETSAYAPRRPVFSSARSSRARHADRDYDLDPHRRLHAVRRGELKLIRYPGMDQDYLELYDLANDPGETRNVATERSAELRELLAVLDEWETLGAVQHVDPRIDPESREQLRSLGYLE